MQPSEPERDGNGPPGTLPGRGTGARIWLVRHAEVHEDWRGRAYGNLDVPLSARGLERTGELARELAELPLTSIRSSPLDRARRLGEAVAQASGAPLSLDPRLAEIHRGEWQGKSVTELHERSPGQVRAFYSDPCGFRGHGGESDAMVAARALRALDDVLDEARGGTAVVTTHYNVIRVLLARALDVPPPRSFGLRIDPAHGALLVDGPEGWLLLHSNAAAPPPEEPRD